MQFAFSFQCKIRTDKFSRLHLESHQATASTPSRYSPTRGDIGLHKAKHALGLGNQTRRCRRLQQEEAEVVVAGPSSRDSRLPALVFPASSGWLSFGTSLPNSSPRRSLLIPASSCPISSRRANPWLDPSYSHINLSVLFVFHACVRSLY